MIADEVDPGAEKQKAKLAERKAETIKDLADAYIELYARPNKRTWAEDRRILNKDVLLRWGERKAKDIDRIDVIALLDEISGRGAPIGANHSLAVIKKCFGGLFPVVMLTAIQRP